jgi:hypothetical protein
MLAGTVDGGDDDVFAQFDKDQDGSLSADEFRKARTIVEKPRGVKLKVLWLIVAFLRCYWF